MTRLARRMPPLAALLLCSVAVAAPAPKEGPPSVPFPAGIADPAAKVAYVTNAAGGIDAVGLDKGNLLWDTKEPAKPLAVAGQRLFVQVPVAGKANAVIIQTLDTSAKGKKVGESEPVTFPDWVSVGGGYGRSFASGGRVRDGALLLTWTARAWYAGGAAPTPEIQKRARKQDEGVAKINLESGKVDMASAEKTPLPKGLEKVTSHGYATDNGWQTKPFLVGKRLMALDLKNVEGGKGLLSLRRWDLATGKEEEPVKLLEGKSLWSQLSGDGHHLIVHQAVGKEQLPKGDYAWWVFDLENGKQLGKLPYEGPLTDAVVLGSRLYYLSSQPSKAVGRPTVQPRSVKAVDLATGKLAWERPVEGVKVLLPLP